MYICLFPDDYSIVVERLYQLWIVEGFVKAKGDKTSEKVAEEYMAKLVRRNLLSLDHFHVHIKKCHSFCVHDLMRDVILSRAEDLNFCQIWDPKASKYRCHGRRLIISDDARKALENVENSGTQSLFLSHTSDDLLTYSFMASLLQKFKLLQVVYFESSRIETLPKELGKMLLLKYLFLRNTNGTSLPKSIGKLQKLCSLDIRETPILELAKEINKLRNMQHILLYRHNQSPKINFDGIIGVRLQEGFGTILACLQTLAFVEAHPGGAALMKELEKLVTLRTLGVVGLTADLTLALCTVIKKPNRLEFLVLFAANKATLISATRVVPSSWDPRAHVNRPAGEDSGLDLQAQEPLYTVVVLIEARQRGHRGVEGLAQLGETSLGFRCLQGTEVLFRGRRVPETKDAATE